MSVTLRRYPCMNGANLETNRDLGSTITVSLKNVTCCSQHYFEKLTFLN